MDLEFDGGIGRIQSRLYSHLDSPATVIGSSKKMDVLLLRSEANKKESERRCRSKKKLAKCLNGSSYLSIVTAIKSWSRIYFTKKSFGSEDRLLLSTLPSLSAIPQAYIYISFLSTISTFSRLVFHTCAFISSELSNRDFEKSLTLVELRVLVVGIWDIISISHVG